MRTGSGKAKRRFDRLRLSQGDNGGFGDGLPGRDAVEGRTADLSNAQRDGAQTATAD